MRDPYYHMAFNLTPGQVLFYWGIDDEGFDAILAQCFIEVDNVNTGPKRVIVPVTCCYRRVRNGMRMEEAIRILTVADARKAYKEAVNHVLAIREQVRQERKNVN